MKSIEKIKYIYSCCPYRTCILLRQITESYYSAMWNIL